MPKYLDASSPSGIDATNSIVAISFPPLECHDLLFSCLGRTCFASWHPTTRFPFVPPIPHTHTHRPIHSFVCSFAPLLTINRVFSFPYLQLCSQLLLGTPAFLYPHPRWLSTPLHRYTRLLALRSTTFRRFYVVASLHSTNSPVPSRRTSIPTLPNATHRPTFTHQEGWQHQLQLQATT